MKIENFRKDAYSLALAIKIVEERYILDSDNYTYYLNLFYKFLMSVGKIMKLAQQNYQQMVYANNDEIKMLIDELNKYEKLLEIENNRELERVKDNCYLGLYNEKDKKYIQEQILNNTMENLEIMKDTEIEELIFYRNYLDKKIKEKCSGEDKNTIDNESLNSKILIKDYCGDISLIKLLSRLNITNMRDLKENGYRNIPEYYHEEIAFLLKFFDFDGKNQKLMKIK